MDLAAVELMITDPLVAWKLVVLFEELIKLPATVKSMEE
jgi:hypothetical protein